MASPASPYREPAPLPPEEGSTLPPPAASATMAVAMANAERVTECWETEAPPEEDAKAALSSWRASLVVWVCAVLMFSFLMTELVVRR
jgi:hypothetical protein